MCCTVSGLTSARSGRTTLTISGGLKPVLVVGIAGISGNVAAGPNVPAGPPEEAPGPGAPVGSAEEAPGPGVPVGSAEEAPGPGVPVGSAEEAPGPGVPVGPAEEPPARADESDDGRGMAFKGAAIAACGPLRPKALDTPPAPAGATPIPGAPTTPAEPAPAAATGLVPVVPAPSAKGAAWGSVPEPAVARTVSGSFTMATV